jgi:hypothetical protein
MAPLLHALFHSVMVDRGKVRRPRRYPAKPDHNGSLGAFSRTRRGVPGLLGAAAGADCANHQATRGSERAWP